MSPADFLLRFVGRSEYANHKADVKATKTKSSCEIRYEQYWFRFLYTFCCVCLLSTRNVVWLVNGFNRCFYRILLWSHSQVLFCSGLSVWVNTVVLIWFYATPVGSYQTNWFSMHLSNRMVIEIWLYLYIFINIIRNIWFEAFFYHGLDMWL